VGVSSERAVVRRRGRPGRRSAVLQQWVLPIFSVWSERPVTARSIDRLHSARLCCLQAISDRLTNLGSGRRSSEAAKDASVSSSRNRISLLRRPLERAVIRIFMEPQPSQRPYGSVADLAKDQHSLSVSPLLWFSSRYS